MPDPSTTVTIKTEWRTPAGKMRNVPMYSATLTNAYLRTTRTFRGTDVARLRSQATAQAIKWDEQERRQKETAAKQDNSARAEAEAAALDAEARDLIGALTSLLDATLAVDDRIDWDSLRDRRVPPAFAFDEAPPSMPDATPREVQPPVYDSHPKRPWYAALLPRVDGRWKQCCAEIDAHNQMLDVQAVSAREQEVARCENIKLAHAASLDAWNARRAAVLKRHESDSAALREQQRDHNAKVDRFKAAFEAGVPEAVTEYLHGVFERSNYPDAFPVTHALEFDPSSRSVSVSLQVPTLEDFPRFTAYTFAKAKLEAKPIIMRQREHEALYERVVAQVVLRTMHETFEADYVPLLQEADVSAFVAFVDPATGRDKREYKASISATRTAFSELDLRRLDPVACVRKLGSAIMVSEAT